MGRNAEDLETRADDTAQELCVKIEQQTKGIYNSVMFIEPSQRPVADPPNLYLHRSDPVGLTEGLVFTLYAVDSGDLAYEPRLQIVEDLLRTMPEVTKIMRSTAPDTMVKDMLSIEVSVNDRRATERSAKLDGGDAKGAS
jgi:hypothetical protein